MILNLPTARKIAGEPPRLSDLLPYTLPNGQVLRTKEDVTHLATQLGAQLGGFVSDREILTGKYDRDPFVREYEVPALSRRVSKRDEQEARYELYRTRPIEEMSDADLLEARNHLEIEEGDRERFEELANELERRMAPGLERKRQEQAVRRTALAAELQENPSLAIDFATAGQWAKALEKIDGYAETFALANLRGALGAARNCNGSPSTARSARIALEMFIASDPELFR